MKTLKKNILIASVSVGAIAVGLGVGIPVGVNQTHNSSTTTKPSDTPSNKPSDTPSDTPSNKPSDTPSNKPSDSNQDLKDASYPTDSTDSYLPQVGSSSERIYDNDSLNSYLNSKLGNNDLYKDNNFSSLFENSASYQNVSVVFLGNSGDFSNKSFKITVSPINGHKWSDGSYGSKVITVKIKNFVNSSIVTNEPSNLSYNESVSNKNGVFDDTTLNDWLKKNFTLSKVSGYDFSHLTNIEYVDNSASYNESLFKITVTTKDGYVWSDGRTDAKTFNVKLNLDKTNYINLPDQWAVDAVGTSTYNSTDYSKIGKAGYDDLSKNYQIDYVGIDNSNSSGKIKINHAWVYYVWINVKPSKGSAWYDGTTTAKSIRILQYSAVWYDQKGYSNISDLSNAAKNRDSYGLPSTWVSNFLWETSNFPYLTSKNLQGNRNVISPLIIKDFNFTYSQWNATITDLLPFSWYRGLGSSPNYDYWTYKLVLVNKENSAIKKTINGFMFVRS